MEIGPLFRLLMLELLLSAPADKKEDRAGTGRRYFAALLALAPGTEAGKTGSFPGAVAARGDKVHASMKLEDCRENEASGYPARDMGNERAPVVRGRRAGLEALVESVARKHGVDPVLAKAVAQAESNFDPGVKSKAGAAGLMQLMPGTAAALGVRDPYDPVQNVEGGVRYLKQLLDRYGGRVELALAAYNAGPGAVDRAGGVPPYRETRSYVRKIMNKVNTLV